MPALDMGYTSTSGSGSCDSGDAVVLYHRNRGLSSVPRAHTWVEFITSGIAGWDEYRLCLSEKKFSSTTDADENNKWTALQISGPNLLGEAMERAITSLAENPPDELGDGSHFIHVILGETAVVKDGEGDSDLLECPNVGKELRVTMIHDDDMYDNQEEVDASSLPTMGILQVAISSAMPGSESDNLPDAYKPLYFDSTLRRPTYERFRQRQEARKQKKASNR